MIQVLEPGVFISNYIYLKIYIYIHRATTHFWKKSGYVLEAVPIDRLQPSAYFPGFFDKNVSSPSIPSISECICSSHGLKDKSLQAATISCSEGQIALRRCFLVLRQIRPMKNTGFPKTGIPYRTRIIAGRVDSIAYSTPLFSYPLSRLFCFQWLTCVRPMTEENSTLKKKMRKKKKLGQTGHHKLG